MNPSKVTWVIGHKNPDTDAICAAVAYAALKNKTAKDGEVFIPKRCGEIGPETRYVLDTFGVPEPEMIERVGVQLSDTDLRPTPGISKEVSLRQAWESMRKNGVVTLPVVSKNRQITGIIVDGDIAYSYMDIDDSEALSRARTSYGNILSTLAGHLWAGDETGLFDRGKVVIGSDTREAMREEIEEGDLVIIGNIWERQMIALREKPACMIICMQEQPDEEVVERAKAQNTVLITTPYDTFTTARLIHQSMPVRQFMTEARNVITFELDEYIDDVKERITKIRHRDFPVVDEHRRYVGMFSRRILLGAQKKRVILVDHNERSQAVSGIEEADILEIIDHHRLGSLETLSPIFFRNQPLGCTSTIVWLMYREQGVEIDPPVAGLMCSAILSDTLMFRSPTCTPVDVEAANALAAIAGIEIRSHASKMFEAGGDFGDKTIEEIIYTDFKIFYAEDVSFAVSQISTVSEKQLDTLIPQIREFMPRIRADKGVHLAMVMLTNILEQESRLLYDGADAARIIGEAFGGSEASEGAVRLPGVVSRKKQVVPAVIEAVQRIHLEES